MDLSGKSTYGHVEAQAHECGERRENPQGQRLRAVPGLSMTHLRCTGAPLSPLPSRLPSSDGASPAAAPAELLGRPRRTPRPLTPALRRLRTSAMTLSPAGRSDAVDPAGSCRPDRVVTNAAQQHMNAASLHRRCLRIYYVFAVSLGSSKCCGASKSTPGAERLASSRRCRSCVSAGRRA